MAEYIEREALIAFLEDVHEDKDWLVNQYNADWICSWIESQPAADVVEVCRCKECRYWQDNNGGYPHEECRWGKDETPDADDFCSYGERKAE